jgi:tetratricopeptide (TPR) repeat protein
MIEAPALQGRDTRSVKAFVLHRLGTFTLEAEQAKQLLLDSLDLYRDLEDRRQIARVSAYLGDLLRTVGDLENSTLALQESLAIQQELGLTAEKIRTLYMLNILALRRGDLPKAERLSEQAVALATRENEPDRLAASLERQGLVHAISGRFIEAERSFQQSTEIRLDLGQQVDISVSRAYLSYANLHLGRLKRARRIAQRALLMAKDRGDLPTSANALWVIGQVALAEGFYEESRQRLKECITNYRAGWQHDWRNRRGNALTILACADCYQGLLAQARGHLRQALKANIATRSYIGLLHTLPAIALLLLKEERIESALEVYELSRTQPVVANSAWFEWAVGRHIDAAARTISPEVLAKARRQGKARDLWGTAAELLEYLNKDH